VPSSELPHTSSTGEDEWYNDDPTDEEWVEGLELKIGFYYGLERNEDADFSLKKWADKMVYAGTLKHVLTLEGDGDEATGEVGIQPTLSKAQESFHNELCWREVGPRSSTPPETPRRSARTAIAAAPTRVSSRTPSSMTSTAASSIHSCNSLHA
jgi:hypothetical protein